MRQKVVCFDLDDTLYKEIDFLKSGYRKVSEMVGNRYSLDAHEVYARLLSWYNQGENPFERMNEAYGLNNPIGDYLNVYRYHQPSILLSQETISTLDALKDEGSVLGIISDGREITQKQKIEALGLFGLIESDFVFINEDKKYFKPNHWSFDRFMLLCYEKYQNANLEFCYVGDNTDKDFLAPNQLGWETICLLDDGRNIHKQNFGLPKENLPKHTIKAIVELLDIIK